MTRVITSDDPSQQENMTVPIVCVLHRRPVVRVFRSAKTKPYIQLTTISPKLVGSPVSVSTTNLMPSGGLLIRSRTSLDTLDSVRGGKFSMEALLTPPLDPRLYCRKRLARAGPGVAVDMEVLKTVMGQGDQ